MSDIYRLSDYTENIATLHEALYSEVPAVTVNTGFHIPKEELPKTILESEK